MRFTRFVDEVLGVRLTPGQWVLCVVAFDGLQPGELEGADRDLARELFGDVDYIPPEARHVLAALCGARGGKSYILAALRLLHLALTVNLDSLAPGEIAVGPIVGPDVRLARQTHRYIEGAIERAPDIAAIVVSSTADSIILKRPDGHCVDLTCLPATRGGSAVRGRSYVGGVMDEAAFFRDSDFQINDGEIFKAIAPRIVPEGQLIIASTPWTEAGLLYEMVEANHGSPTTAIGCRAPTLLLRDDAHTRSLVEREQERDPDNALREFGAVPMSAGTTEWFDPGALREAETEDPLVHPPTMLGPASMGLDTAFRKDSTAGVIVRTHEELIHVCEVAEFRPTPGKRLVPSVVLSQLMDRARHHKADRVVCDQHYVETVREHATGIQLVEVPGGIAGKVEVYTAARTALHEGRVRISKMNRRLLLQLRQVVSKPTPGGQVTISSPRRGGAHGDLASAWVGGVWDRARQGRRAGPWEATTRQHSVRHELGITERGAWLHGGRPRPGSSRDMREKEIEAQYGHRGSFVRRRHRRSSIYS